MPPEGPAVTTGRVVPGGRAINAIFIVPVRIVHAARRAVTMARVAIGTRRGRTTELWFGDSHAMTFNGPITNELLRRADDGQIVCHLGPRLMFSVARHGFPPYARRIARRLRRIGDGRQVLPVFVFGEIDVRCHLATRVDADGAHDLGFVRDYVAEGCELALSMGAARAVFTVPPPPSIDAIVLPGYPIVGTIEERIATFHELREALGAAVADHRGPVRATLFDATSVLSDANGGLQEELTYDGIHTNASGVAQVRREFGQFLGQRAPSA